MTTVLLSIALIGLFFVMMSVRLIFIKGGKFRGTCASQSPFLNKEGGSCGMCGKKVDPGEGCQSNMSRIDKVLAKFN